MPKKKSREEFFQRAREKGSDISKGIVNGDEVQKELQPKTWKNYARALGLWDGQVHCLTSWRVFAIFR